jgi:hypothetical protein
LAGNHSFFEVKSHHHQALMYPQDRDVSSSPVAHREDFDESISTPSRPNRRFDPDIAFWSTAKRESFTLMETNPNAYFFALDQTQRHWSMERKKEAIVS